MKISQLGFLGISILLMFVFGCSVGNEPDTNSQYSEVSEGLAIADGQMDLLEQSGYPLEDCKAIFSLGWKEIFVPMLSTTETAGHAFAVAFAQPLSQHPRPFNGGIDMGSVSINYQTNQLEMRKLVGPGGGVAYSLGHRPGPGMANTLEYIPNTTYEFDVTGSANFDPLQIDLTSPPALLSFTSHSLGDTISAAGDLTLDWTGGNADSGLVIHIHPAHFRPIGVRPAPGQMPMPGQRPPHGGPGQRGLMPPPPPISPNSIIVVLDDNPGSYTISSSDLQDLINQTSAQGIICGVSQMDLQEIDLNGELVRAVLHNGDRVGLILE